MFGGSTRHIHFIPPLVFADSHTISEMIDRVVGNRVTPTTPVNDPTTHSATVVERAPFRNEFQRAYDDLVSIGDGSVVELYFNDPVEKPVPDGTATHTFDPDGAGTVTARQVEIATVEGVRNVYETSGGNRGTLLGTEAVISAMQDATLDPIPGASLPILTYSLAYSRSTAMGSHSLVRGDNSVAIGNNAKVIRVEPAGATGATERRVNVDNGVAIGANAEVTGIGGIAIGGGTGIDANDDGDYTDEGDTARTTVSAGANEIRIGGDNHAGVITLGNIDLRAEQARITTNANAIQTNTNAIQTNTKGIATAIAIAGLATGPGSGLSIGFGSFKSETALAMGYDSVFGAKENISFKAAASTTDSSNTAGSLSLRWAF